MDLLDCVVGFIDRAIVAVTVVSCFTVISTMVKQNHADPVAMATLTVLMYLTAPVVGRMFSN